MHGWISETDRKNSKARPELCNSELRLVGRMCGAFEIGNSKDKSFEFEEVSAVISDSVSHEIINMPKNKLSLHEKKTFLAVCRFVLF